MTLTVAEWVLPGHPDKICDAVADRIVGEALRTDSMAQCGVEVACAFHHIFVTGLVGSMQDGWPELAALMPGWIRSTYRDAGYGDPWNPEPGALRIDLEALRFENRTGPWRELRHLSDDQAICIGYAQATPETDYLPGAHSYARKIARALFEQRARDDFDSRVLKDLGPDGKVIVRGEDHADGRFTPLSVSVSLHHAEQADWLALRRFAEAAVREACGSTGMPDLQINGAGMFICGGPMGDNGTTGKKLVIDAYGPTVPIGGGAWCGKDFHKPDRAGGMLARRMALECVQLGLGTRIRVQLEYRPNSPAPESVQVWADGRAVELPRTVKVPGTKEIAQEVMRGLERQNFTPLMTGQFARWGHFGSGEWWGVPRPEARKVLNSHSTGPRSS